MGRNIFFFFCYNLPSDIIMLLIIHRMTEQKIFITILSSWVVQFSQSFELVSATRYLIRYDVLDTISATLILRHASCFHFV